MYLFSEFVIDDNMFAIEVVAYGDFAPLALISSAVDGEIEQSHAVLGGILRGAVVPSSSAGLYPSAPMYSR